MAKKKEMTAEGKLDALKPADQRALFNSLFNPILSLERQIDELKAEQKEHIGIAKEVGFTSTHISEGIKVIKATDKAKALKRQKHAQQVMYWLGLTPDQLELFLEAERRAELKPADERAYDEGYQAALGDQPLRNPYSPSVPQFARFAAGWHAGRPALERAMREIAEMRAEREAPATLLKPEPEQPSGVPTFDDDLEPDNETVQRIMAKMSVTTPSKPSNETGPVDIASVFGREAENASDAQELAAKRRVSRSTATTTRTGKRVPVEIKARRRSSGAVH